MLKHETYFHNPVIKSFIDLCVPLKLPVNEHVEILSGVSVEMTIFKK